MVESYYRGLRPVATQEHWLAYDHDARELAASLLASDSENVTNAASTHVRPALPQVDLDPGEDTAWDGDTAEWLQNASSATSQGDEVHVYTFDKSGSMDDRTAVLYGFRDLDGGGLSDVVSQIILRDGSGGRIEQYDLSQLDVQDYEDYAALIENPIALREDKTLEVYFVAQGDLAANDVHLQFATAVAEPEGEHLAESSRFSTDV